MIFTSFQCKINNQIVHRKTDWRCDTTEKAKRREYRQRPKQSVAQNLFNIDTTVDDYCCLTINRDIVFSRKITLFDLPFSVKYGPPVTAVTTDYDINI